MPRVTYNWKRFYQRPAGILNLSDAGFLVDPDGEHGATLNPDAVPFDSLASTQCLILLGEPGIGKSEAMRSEAARIQAATVNSADRVLSIDLRSFQTDQRLHEQVFDSPTIKQWKADASRLYLFLDGLDECLMRIDNIASVLLQAFGELDLERLNIRIACRTASWPRDFEGDLQNLWNQDGVGVCELAPLRRVDVLEAARANAINPPELFIEEVVRLGIVPFAIKPVTLQFLLNTRTRPSGMPTTQAELYSEGCRVLCEDRRPGRQPARSHGELSAEKRLAVASRIAAVTMFCNRDAVWIDIDRGDVPPEDILIRDLVKAESSEGANSAEDEIFQALDTGLFSSRGIPRIGWAHQTYCEYLAARFLVDGKQPVETMMSLLLHPDGKVIPQLRETAAWVATLVPQAFQRILAADPMCLLSSDAATADPKERQELTESLLLLFEAGKLFDLGWGLWQRFPKLQHPKLDQQLRPIIIDRTKNVVVRRVAIMIAQICEVYSGPRISDRAIS